MQTLKGNCLGTTELEYSYDGRLLAACNANGSVRIWSAASGKLKHLLLGHKINTNTIAFSPCGKYLASGDAAGKIKLWSVGKGKELGELNGHKNGITDLIFLKKSLELISVSHDGFGICWDLKELMKKNRNATR